MLRKKGGFLVRVMPWIGAGVLLAMFVILVRDAITHESPFTSDSPTQLGLGVALPLLLVLLPATFRRALRRQYRNNPMLSEARTLQADFSGLHFRSASSSTDQTWSNYVAYAEDASSFLLIQQGNLLFVPIPKRQLTPAQADEVRSVFETYLPRK